MVCLGKCPRCLVKRGGRDFGSFLGAVAQLGYGFAYRVLDAQWFGVAQRRRRVFVVGYFGDWRPAAAVLFEYQSLRRNTAPSREKGQTIAPTVVSGPPFSRTGNERVECDAIVAMSSGQSGAEIRSDGGAPTLTCLHEAPIIAQPIPFGVNESPDIGHSHAVAQPIGLDEEQNAMIDAFGTLKARTAGGGFEGSVMQTNMQVRRLTPVECERLQGFPDNYTKILWRGKTETPDGPRYKALGNSMAVPVMKWIGEGIDDVNSLG
jgi:DNA (cytosine-5)-methyltransferase 1